MGGWMGGWMDGRTDGRTAGEWMMDGASSRRRGPVCACVCVCVCVVLTTSSRRVGNAAWACRRAGRCSRHGGCRRPTTCVLPPPSLSACVCACAPARAVPSVCWWRRWRRRRRCVTTHAPTDTAGSDSTGAVRGGHMGTWDKPKRREGRQQPPGPRLRRSGLDTTTNRPSRRRLVLICLWRLPDQTGRAPAEDARGAFCVHAVHPRGRHSRHRRGRARWWASPFTTADGTTARWAPSASTPPSQFGRHPEKT